MVFMLRWGGLTKVSRNSLGSYESICEFATLAVKGNTVRPRDTRPQAARTLQVHVFELGPKKFELNEFM